MNFSFIKLSQNLKVFLQCTAGPLLIRAFTRMAARRISSAVQKERTFQYQDSLPSLPVPPLEQTCHKYLESGTRPDCEFMQCYFIY